MFWLKRSLAKMAIVHERWPWKLGQCNCCPPEMHGCDIDQWVIQCTQCKQNFCENKTIDSCSICGFPYCNDCYYNHAPCVRNAVLEKHPCLVCRFQDCDHLKKIGNGPYCCEDCLQEECNSRLNCYSHIYPTNCGHGDRCEECASWCFDPERIGIGHLGSGWIWLCALCCTQFDMEHNLLPLIPDSGTDTTSVSEQEYTCLLYTSPSPRDGLLSRMPSSA